MIEGEGPCLMMSDDPSCRQQSLYTGDPGPLESLAVPLVTGAIPSSSRAEPTNWRFNHFVAGHADVHVLAAWDISAGWTG